MSALPFTEYEAFEPSPVLGVELEHVVAEIAESEAALDELILRAGRLHSSNIAHEPRTCVLCFVDR